MTSAAATKRLTLFFAEGCVDSLVAINDALKDAQSEEDRSLEKDIDQLLLDLGIRQESSSSEDL
jgi:hypothetical protein